MQPHHQPVRITRHPTLAGWQLTCGIALPHPREQVFAFFADAFELERITPPWLQFRVATPPPLVMATGLCIDYRMKLHKIPVPWRSHIPVWDPPHRFVDEQQRGPYLRWHHTHTFQDLGDHTLVRDEVHYRVLGGALVHRLLVKRDLLAIFTYRTKALQAIFSGSKPTSNRG